MANFEVGAISEKRMKEYDEMCLVQEGERPYKAEKSAGPSIVMEHVTV
jgi:hypothetical protein